MPLTDKAAARYALDDHALVIVPAGLHPKRR